MNIILIDRFLEAPKNLSPHYLFFGAESIPHLADVYEGVEYTLSPELAKLYDLATDSVRVNLLKIDADKSDAASEGLIRSAVTPIIHCFIERLSRLLHVGSYVPSDSFVALPEGVKKPVFLTIDSLAIKINGDPVFNQFLLADLAPLCAKKVLSVTITELPTASERTTLTQKNTNFLSVSPNISLSSFVVRKFKALRRKANVNLSRYFGQEMVVAPGTAAQYFREHGLIGPGYWRDPDVTKLRLERLVTPQINPSLRQKLFSLVAEDLSAAVCALVSRHKNARLFSGAHLSGVIAKFFENYYPVWHLEGAAALLLEQRKLCGASINKNFYIGDGSFSTTDAAYRSVAKHTRHSLIGFQHGGHYGYARDHVSAIEAEYRHYDYFLSWGWTELDQDYSFPLPKFLDLPSPWLSERSVEWSKSIRKMRKLGWPSKTKFDILLMPIHYHRFPSSPSGRAISTMCTLAQNRKVFEDICQAAAESELLINVKFFNSLSYTLYEDISEHFIDNKTLTVSGHANKGMVPSLIQESSFVVWDQPGTGFLECLVARIPTLVLWRRLHNSEVDSSRDYFEMLEKVGVVFRDPESLMAAVVEHRGDPLAWLNEPLRRQAIERFSKRYGRADPSWVREWKSTIRWFRS